MIPLLQRLFSAAYLYATSPAPEGPRIEVWSLWGAYWLGLALLSRWWCRRLQSRHRDPYPADWLMALCAAGMLAVWLQGTPSGPFSARIWALSLALLAPCIPLAYWASERSWPRGIRFLTAGLAAAPTAPSLAPWPWAFLWSLGHALGLLWLAQDSKVIAALALLVPVCLVITALVTRQIRLEILAPLLFPYAAKALRGLLEHGLGIPTAPYAAFPYPDMWSPWFSPMVAAVFGLGWVVVNMLMHVGRGRGALRWISAGILLAGMGWWLFFFGKHSSHGVSGSDPYCYLQMAHDLTKQGDLRHYFPLIEIAQKAEVPVWPLAPVGYHPPINGWAATVWPAGWPFLMAPWYAIGGERLALWAAPCWLLAAAAMTQLLAKKALEGLPSKALLAGLLAAGLWLTDFEALTRSLVPMADAATAALSAGMLAALLHARQRDDLRWSAVAGGLLALAYWVHHAQLPLGLAALPAFLAVPWRNARKAQHFIAFGGAALLGALPDLYYHTAIFGRPWATESAEWFLISPRFIPKTLTALLHNGFLRRDAFGYLWGLVGLGLVAQLGHWQERPRAWVLLTGLIGTLLFHLCYRAVRWRDLIGLFPILAVWASRGALYLWRWANAGPSPNARRGLALGVLVFAIASRTTVTLGLPWREQVLTFGYVTAAEREGLEQLGDLLPPQAVIGASLNAGAIMRYTGHDAVRPAVWQAEAFDRFVQALEREGRPLYLLVDGEEMATWLPTLAGRYDLSPQGILAVPLYGRGGQRLEGTAQLYRLFPRP